VTGGEEVDLWMRGYNPKPIVLALEAIHSGSLIEIPDPDCLVLARREDQVLMRMEQGAVGILEVAPASINFPLDP
jgi:hypothetical protein